MVPVKMRRDLAQGRYTVPAFDDILEDGEEVGDTYLSSHDLKGAMQLPDLCDDTHAQYNFNRVQLKDGRIFFMIGVDLDWI